ncbi:MAG: hypothetical protein HQK49_10180 [Oligoflexia bacterium]|nr:hypothetical protein [Oligoflexia bacterium]
MNFNSSFNINFQNIFCKTISLISLLLIAIAIFATNSSTSLVYANENEPILNLKYKAGAEHLTHQKITTIAATALGLSIERVKNIAAASGMPDKNQGGISGGFNQQWSHGLLFNNKKEIKWGDANTDYHDNLLGLKNNDRYDDNPLDEIDETTSSVKLESWENGSADKFYLQNDQQKGDWYLGYASHYIVDLTTPIHTTVPGFSHLEILSKHFNFELWIANNFDKGHNLATVAINDNKIYSITNPREDAKKAAWNACYWNDVDGYGQRLWDLYKQEGYPTEENSGNAELVEAAKIMILEAVRWSKSTIKWGLDNYQQWD